MSIVMTGVSDLPSICFFCEEDLERICDCMTAVGWCRRCGARAVVDRQAKVPRLEWQTPMGGKPLKVPTVMIEIPVGPLVERYQFRQVDLELYNALWNSAQRRTMGRIFTGLDMAGRRTADGKRVGNMTEALRWLMEKVAAAVEKGARD